MATVLSLALADQLNIALSVHNSHQGRFSFTHRSLEVQGGIKKWTDDGVFRKSGIRTKTGQRYSGPKMKAAKYGYRLGTEQEASSQQLVKE